MEGFTGLDIERAINDIHLFHYNCSDVFNDLDAATYDFFILLEKKWASPKAVQFYSEYREKINKTFGDFKTTFLHIISGAVDAATTLAAANGASFNYDRETISAGETRDYSLAVKFETSINDAVGMDRENVKIALDLFTSRISSGLAKLESIPSSISFYDPNGEMVGSYNRNIAEFKSQFEELFNEISTAVSGYIETESDNILLAKEQANDTMNA